MQIKTGRPRGRPRKAQIEPSVVNPERFKFKPGYTGVKTDFVDHEVTPETANANAVSVTKQTHGDDEMSTTEKLFGDIVDQEKSNNPLISEPINQNPLEESQQDEVQEAQKIEEKQENPPEVSQEEVKPEVQEEEFIDVDKLGTRKIRTKVDGVEEVLTLKELRDRAQLKKHLNQAADKVGEERRRLAEERRQLQELRQRQSNFTYPVHEPTYQPQENVSRGTESVEVQNPALYAEIQSIKQQLNQFMEGTRPIVYQSNRQRVAEELKGQGFDDFLDYIPKMESHLVNIEDPGLLNYYDTPNGAKSLYFQLKAQELQNSARQPVKNQPAPQQPVPTPRPPITKIDGGGQAGGDVNDDGVYTYRQSFKRAVAMNDDKEAWNDVLRKKGIISED